MRNCRRFWCKRFQKNLVSSPCFTFYEVSGLYQLLHVKARKTTLRQLPKKTKTAAVGLKDADQKTKLEDYKVVQLYKTHTQKNQHTDEITSTLYTRKSASMMWRKLEATHLLSFVKRVFLCPSMKSYMFELTFTELIYHDVLHTMSASCTSPLC